MKIGNLEIDKLILGDVEIPKAYLGEDVVYESGGGNPYENQYLTFIAGEGGAELFLHPTDSSISKDIQYSIDGGTWISTTTELFTSISLAEGERMMFRGNNNTYADSSKYNTFSGTTGNLTIEGNIMSLIYGDDFIGQKTFPEGTSYNFKYLFSNILATMNVENLVLPATALTEGCYSSMFEACENLLTAPSELPATTLANDCYGTMFNNCTSLTTAPPILPATTLADGCYFAMFGNCTSLTTAPELPATTLAYYCYGHMFESCSSLNYIKCLATSVEEWMHTDSWVIDVQTTSGTFVKAAGVTWSRGDSGIPNNWTVEDA